jgi:SAM-dependent methyltransferase
MPHDDPAQFYTGLVAQLYGPLRSAGAPDPTPYARFIERAGEPALELGCGEGEPLLDLRALGFDVEGLDSSPDMLDRCRAAASARGLDVVVHLQPMETMQIDRRFRSIFIAGPTFNLLPDDATALRALTQIRLHLAPGGSVLIPLFVPEPTPIEVFGRARSHSEDGVEMSVTPLSEVRDESARTQITMLRYEIAAEGGTLVEDRPWLLHWYSQADIRLLVGAAGLTVARMLRTTGGPAGEDDHEVVLVLRDDA